MRPDELLRLARSLAADRRGVPVWVARNRAVSTGYYALFHALADFCGRELVGARRPWQAFRHVYRSLDHGHARRVLQAARRAGDASEAVKIVADIFTDLQEQRQEADYDPAYRITGTDLRALLADAELAMGTLADIVPQERKLLAARLIGRTRA